MAQLIREWVMSCQQCFRVSRIDRSLTRPPLQNPNEHITAPENAMQIDLVPELPPSGGYEKNCDSYGCVFPLFICIADIKSGPQNNCESPC